MPIGKQMTFTPVEPPVIEDAPDLIAARLAQIDEFCASAKSTGADDAECDTHAADLKRRVEAGENPALYADWPS